MAKIWNIFSGEYLFNLSGAPIGSYEEASALFTSSGRRHRTSSRRKEKHEPGTGVRLSKRVLLKSKDMGANVSCHSEKGLSGRRAHSSGNLCKNLAPKVGRVLNACGDGGVKRKDRNKFSGSLPNRLDDKEAPKRNYTPDPVYCTYQELWGDTHPKNFEILLEKLLLQQSRGLEDDLLVKRSDEDGSSVVTNANGLSFITKENTFEARLEKGSRGLGISVTGGADTKHRYPGLIRIKRIFPHQPAWECKALELGDLILEANGVPLTGLSNHEALEVLRTTPSSVVLKVCRPPPGIFPDPSFTPGEPPPPPARGYFRHFILSSQNSESSDFYAACDEPCGEFEVTLSKVNGSLGFTLRKEDESILGHYVRALVREPAISDGRIRPGDKIVSVNGSDISSLSHKDAVSFLRHCGEEVTLRLYRDPDQTPVAALSPAESHRMFRPKPALRKEAMDMLSDLAFKKIVPRDSRDSSRSRLKSSSPGSSPRRRRLTKKESYKEKENIEARERVPSFQQEGTRRHPSDRVIMMPEVGSSSESEAVTEIDTHEHCKFANPVLGSSSEGLAGSDSGDENLPSEPASMPPMSSSSEFSHKNPVYLSAHPTVHAETDTGQERHSDQNIPKAVFRERGGSQGLLKWKGVVFTSEDGDDEEKKASYSKDQMLTVELSRGWNSRLGFSLQSCDSATLISAIYPDSVAAKDGRLQSGDMVVMINDEPTDKMKTSEIIDLLRKVRGPITITVVRSC